MLAGGSGCPAHGDVGAGQAVARREAVCFLA